MAFLLLESSLAALSICGMSWLSCRFSFLTHYSRFTSSEKLAAKNEDAFRFFYSASRKTG